MSVKVNALPVESAPVITDSTINDSANVVTKRTTWQKIYDLFFAAFNSYASGISAAGTNQATATIITKKYNRIDTVAAGTGVVEDISAVAGKGRILQNNGVNDLLWYPFGTNQFYEIDGTGLQGAGIPTSIAPGNTAEYFPYSNGVLTIIRHG
jgi:deoxyhypusine synthase